MMFFLHTEIVRPKALFGLVSRTGPDHRSVDCEHTISLLPDRARRLFPLTTTARENVATRRES
jgi:hypothetical protein